MAPRTALRSTRFFWAVALVLLTFLSVWDFPVLVNADEAEVTEECTAEDGSCGAKEEAVVVEEVEVEVDVDVEAAEESVSDAEAEVEAEAESVKAETESVVAEEAEKLAAAAKAAEEAAAAAAAAAAEEVKAKETEAAEALESAAAKAKAAAEAAVAAAEEEAAEGTKKGPFAGLVNKVKSIFQKKKAKNVAAASIGVWGVAVGMGWAYQRMNADEVAGQK